MENNESTKEFVAHSTQSKKEVNQKRRRLKGKIIINKNIGNHIKH